MHNVCIGELGNTPSLPIMMLNFVSESNPFWALGVHGRISRLQYLSIRPYTPEYTTLCLQFTAVYREYLFAPCGWFNLNTSIVVRFVPIFLHGLPLPNNCTPFETNLG